MPGDLLLWKVTPAAPWKDRLIGWGEARLGDVAPGGMQYYHVAFVSANPKLMYSSQPPKIDLYSIPDPLPSNVEMWRLDTMPTVQQLTNIFAYANSRRGKIYDFAGVFTGGFIEIGGLEFCSRYTENAYAHGQYLLSPNVGYPTPDDIASTQLAHKLITI